MRITPWVAHSLFTATENTDFLKKTVGLHDKGMLTLYILRAFLGNIVLIVR